MGNAYDSLEGKSLTCLRQYRVTEEGRGFPEIQRLRSYRYIAAYLYTRVAMTMTQDNYSKGKLVPH